jgi:hypothetical protein
VSENPLRSEAAAFRWTMRIAAAALVLVVLVVIIRAL